MLIRTNNMELAYQQLERKLKNKNKNMGKKDIISK